MTFKVDKNWWMDLFDEVYIKTDARSVCDDALTCREVDFITSLLGMKKTDPVLDLCGGQGRHTLELAARGFKNLTLLDYSSYLLGMGKKRAGKEDLKTTFIQGDARRTGLRDELFQYILILGSSFGYFTDDHENEKILKEAHRLMMPGGGILLDLPDREHVIEKFKPFIRHSADEDIQVSRERELKDDIIYTCETVTSQKKGCIRKNGYCMKLYSKSAISKLLDTAGFIRITFTTNFFDRSLEGDYGSMTNRMIVQADKAS